jgi:hypothetical protein
MSSSSTERSGTASSTDQYDMALDDAPLTQEEEAAISQIEKGAVPSQPPRTSPSSTPALKKRKRGRSASPHITPSRLRSAMKPTARALDAGFKPNTSHSFRQEPSLGTIPGIPADVGAMGIDTQTRRSESAGPSGALGHPGTMGMAAGDRKYPSFRSHLPAHSPRQFSTTLSIYWPSAAPTSAGRIWPSWHNGRSFGPLPPLSHAAAIPRISWTRPTKPTRHATPILPASKLSIWERPATAIL